ncbi:MAG TPA: hypothetical protein DD738_04835 [Ruminiclostridium sp.]|nr:hypothetical protein [Ruminiclostridium sp.]
MTGLTIAAFVLMAIGALINYGGKLIVKRMGLAEKVDVTEAQEFTGEELEKYKFTKALARVKMLGFVILLIGVLILFDACK